MTDFVKTPLFFIYFFKHTSNKFWDQSSFPHCPCCLLVSGYFFCTSFCVATLQTCCNIEQGGWAWIIYEKWIIPELPGTSRNFQELTWSEYFKWDIVAGYIKNELSMLQEMPSWFFSSKSTYGSTKHLHQWQTLGLCTFLQVWSIKGWARLAEFLNNLKSQHFLYLVWHLKLETRKSLLLLCVFRYTFSFTLRLTSTLLQKLAKFYMWNVKQEDDGMNQKSKTPLLLRWIYDFKSVNLNI